MTQQQTLSFRDIEHLLRELVLPFNAIGRTVPLPAANSYRNENNAEHSWSLALIASMLAPQLDSDLDVGKVCQYAVVHDLVEVYSGDTSIFGSQQEIQTQKDRERIALEKIAQNHPHSPWLIAHLEEYEEQSTPEARFVRAVDALLPILYDYISGGAYYHQNGNTKDDFIKFRERSRSKAEGCPAILALHEELVAEMLEHPEFFTKTGQ